MKVYLYINKKGFKENTFRIAFKELVKVGAEGVKSADNMYLVGKYEARDNDNSFEVPYNKNMKIDILPFRLTTGKKVFQFDDCFVQQ